MARVAASGGRVAACSGRPRRSDGPEPCRELGDTRSRRRIPFRRRSGSKGPMVSHKSAARLDREIVEYLADKPRRTRARLPRYDKHKGMWRGGDGRTLYAFTSLVTGDTFVLPGGRTHNIGPEVTVRIATRDEA